MPQSLAKVYLHIVLSTKSRTPFLQSLQLRRDLEGYFVGILNNLDCPSVATKAMPDHLHCLCRLSRTMSIAKLLEETKRSSSKWIKTQDGDLRGFAWQLGYGAFSVSQSQLATVIRYIERQEEHHARRGFQQELRALLRKHEIEFDERYVWD